MVGTAKPPDSQCWGDMLRSIDAERRTLPWKSGDFIPGHTISLAERKLRERDVDPIAMVYRDSDRESNASKMQMTANANLLARSEEISRKTFDFVSHKGQMKKIDSDVSSDAAMGRKDKGREWHLLSHLKHDIHTKLPVHYPDDDRLELQKKNPVPIRKGRDSGRDFHVVSGKFKIDDEAKQERIASQIREGCEKKFWQTHDYDFIKVKSYDLRKEEEFLDKYKALEKIQGVSQASRYPHCLSHSEGQTYNILNHTILDEERLNNGPMFNDIRAKNRIKAKKMDDMLHITGDLNALIAEEKSLKKITYKRWEREMNRGYNMLNNCAFETDRMHMPSAYRPSSTWHILQNAQNIAPLQTTIKENNFLGTHEGTGMNIHRASTSVYTARRPGDIINNSNPSSIVIRKIQDITENAESGENGTFFSEECSSSLRPSTIPIGREMSRTHSASDVNANTNEKIVKSMRLTSNVNSFGSFGISGRSDRGNYSRAVSASLDATRNISSYRSKSDSAAIQMNRLESPMISVRTGGISSTKMIGNDWE